MGNVCYGAEGPFRAVATELRRITPSQHSAAQRTCSLGMLPSRSRRSWYTCRWKKGGLAWCSGTPEIAD